MSQIAQNTLRQARQAGRVCTRRASLFGKSSAPLAHLSQRRNYVSESKKDNATVNVDTAIKADQKAFFNQTGNKAENVIMPTTGMSADTMMSPAAGKSSPLIPPLPSKTLTEHRHVEASYDHGRGNSPHLPGHAGHDPP